MPRPLRDDTLGLWRILLRLAEVLIAVYLVIDGLVTPVLRPLVLWIIRNQVFVRVLKLATDLPPYGILALMAAPFAIAEPAKLYALYLIGTGHSTRGLLVLGLAHLVTLVVVERLYTAGRAKLRTIRWFARIMDWLIGYRDRLLRWARSTPIWAYAARLRQRLRVVSRRTREKIRRFVARLRLRFLRPR